MDNQPDSSVPTQPTQSTDNQVAQYPVNAGNIQDADTNAPSGSGGNMGAEHQETSNAQTPAVGGNIPLQTVQAVPQATQPVVGGNIPLQPVQAAPQVTRPVVTANTPSAPGQVQDNTPKHPGVQKANLLRDIAWGLSGGQRYDYSVDQDGNTVKSERPVSGGRLALAAALSVIGKGLTGASFNQAKPGAAAEFFSKQNQEKQQQDQQAQAKAQREFQNQETVKLRQAQVAETNSRFALNMAQAQKLGLDALMTQQALATDDYNDQKEQGNIAENGDGITDEEFHKGLAEGRFEPLAQEGGIKGITYRNGQPVPTYYIVNNPQGPARTTQKTFDMLSEVYPNIFKPGTQVGDNLNMTHAQLNKYMQGYAMVKNMGHEFDKVYNTLSQSGDSNDKELAKNMQPIEDAVKDPENNMELVGALASAQKYLTHGTAHLYDDLQTMANPMRAVGLSGAQQRMVRQQYEAARQAGDNRSQAEWMQDNNIGVKPNPDAAQAETVANAFGGWDALTRFEQKNAPELQRTQGVLDQFGERFNKPGESVVNNVPVINSKLAPDVLNTVTNAIDENAEKNGINVNAFRALAKSESNFDPEAIGRDPRTKKESGALGLFQFTHGTWDSVGKAHPELGLKEGNQTDPVLSAKAAGLHFADLLSKSDIKGDYAKAVAAYHDGYKAFQDAEGNISKMSQDAQDQAQKVMGLIGSQSVPITASDKTNVPLSRMFTINEQKLIARKGLDSFIEGTPGQPSKMVSEMMSPSSKSTPEEQQTAASIVAKLNNANGQGNAIDVYRDKATAERAATTTLANSRAKQQAAGVTGRDDNGNWIDSSTPVQLMKGNIGPTQLPKRSDQIMQVFQSADEYAQQKYGVPYDVRKAQTDMQYASNVQTQNTLKFLNSLTGKDGNSGNLAQLVKLSNSIPRTQYPPFNNIEMWAKVATGNPQVAAYRGVVTEVADQVAKILQGGGSGNGTSDAKLKQAADLFQVGFTPQQIAETVRDLSPLLQNRKTEMIGNNQFLLRDYGRPLLRNYTRAEFSDGVIRDVPPDKWDAARNADQGIKLVQIGQ